MFDYRKFYFDTLGIEDKQGYDIHHIDFNRENNSIKNLVMLDSKLHHKYHMCVNALNSQLNELGHKEVSVDLVCQHTEYYYAMLEKLIDAQYQIHKAIVLRDCQLYKRQIEG